MEKELLELHADKLTLGGKPFYIASGDMQYFRFFRGGWERRLRLMKDFGLTCVQTYVPWDLHEPEKGTFCFEGNLDLAAFIRMAGDIGLKVLLRPSPYMCAEWDMGGMPSWLLRDRDMCLRTRDPKYMRHVRDYFTRLMAEVTPLQSTHGGPIIAMAVENEYGSFGNDVEYLRQVAELMRELGVDVPLYTANGPTAKHLVWGSPREMPAAMDAPGATEKDAEIMREWNGAQPVYVAEEWGGRAQIWGGYFNRKSPEEAAADYKRSLENGCMVNFYMFCGGTSFGFMNGANYGVFRADAPDARRRYLPFCTSYDTDAPVSENGCPTKKYFMLKKVLADYLGKPYEEKEYPYAAQNIGEIKLTQASPLLSNLDAVCERKVFSPNVKCMEDLGQRYGFILYETFIPHTDDNEKQLCVKEVADRATVYGNGKYLGTLMRDRYSEVRFRIPQQGLKLQILVENMGRVCYGYPLLFDRKGIEWCVRMDSFTPDGRRMHDFSVIMNWTIYTLPMEHPETVPYTGTPEKGLPGFYKGEFDAQPGMDTFLRLPGWKKGVVFVNGFNLGRYWHIGPQETLYVPGELLKEHNTVTVFEIHTPNDTTSIECIDHPLLDSITENAESIPDIPQTPADSSFYAD